MRTRAARHAKKAQHARRRQCHAKPPTQHTQPRACAQKTRTHWTAVRTRAARAICTIKHASTDSMRTHSMRVDASATQSPPPSTHSHAHVPKKHAQIHLRRVWPNAHGAVLFPPCTPEHYARQLHGSGHTRPLASAKNIQETNTRLHIQARQIGAGAVAARAHRRCLCAYRRQSNVGEARQCSVYVNMTVCNKWVAFSIFCGINILKTCLGV